MVSLQKSMLMRHNEDSTQVKATAETVFAYIDDYSNLSSHMTEPSWMLGGGSMNYSFDEGHGQKVGSHIRLSGKAFGIKLFLDEVITRYEPPRLKIWETVGSLRLIVIGHYRMGVEVEPQGNISFLRVYIDYDSPAKNAWLGRLFGGFYAKWCVQQIIKGTRDHFPS